jgi:hypothetical protein
VKSPLCAACGQKVSPKLARTAYVLGLPEGHLYPVCPECAGRGVLVVSMQSEMGARFAAAPYASHFRRLAKAYQHSGDEVRSAIFEQAAGILESGRVPSDEPRLVMPKLSQQVVFQSLRAETDELLNLGPKKVRTETPKVNGSTSSTSMRPALTHLSDMSRCEETVLRVLAVRRGVPTSRDALAILSEYSLWGGGFNSALARLRRWQLIEGDRTNYRITDAGVVVAGPVAPLPKGQELLDHWVQVVGSCAGDLLQAYVAAHPDTLSKEQLAERTNYSPNGGGFNAGIAKLRKLRLIEGSRASFEFIKAIRS